MPTVLAAAITFGVVAAARTRDRPLRLVLLAALPALAAWAGAYALINTGWQDVDGFVDCNRSCRTEHYAGAALFLTPPLTALALLVAAAASALRRRPPASSSNTPDRPSRRE